MARPQRCRRICMMPEYDRFSPQGSAGGAAVALTLDEYEALRLIDYEKLTHEACAARMQISRTTVTEIYERARFAVADSLVNGRPLVIAGGNYRFCGGGAPCCRSGCFHARSAEFSGGEKGENSMRIAVTYENGDIFQHFGHTRQFKLYDTENGAVKKEQVVQTDGEGHGALAAWLRQSGAEALVCGGIGAGAVQALQSAGIRIYAGAEGQADAAVRRLLAGELPQNSAANCSHHDEGHACGGHACGEDKHGCAGN
ncbi:MAG: DUF134 domain-containing protein [Oscillospiraceae bacterium]|nr:DUF134 domain-containing protein [Oscillospiraceae bacterium]